MNGDFFNKLVSAFKQRLEDTFPYQKPHREKQLLENIKNGSFFAHVTFGIAVADVLWDNFPIFQPIFKEVNVIGTCIRVLIKNKFNRR